MSAFDEAFDYLRQNRPQGRFMGGSTGARGHDLPMGRFVEKRGAHPDHIQNEFDMNQYLNALGVAVPQAGLQGRGRRRRPRRRKRGQQQLRHVRGGIFRDDRRNRRVRGINLSSY